MNEPWILGQKIIMLEPRRLAARSCAAHMAHLLGEPVGRQVGYRIRHDHQISKQTRIEIMTEGLFTRKIQQDPFLEGVGLVIFDEFHERSIHSDLGLALCLDASSGLREDLRILVMSATLDTGRIAKLLTGAPIISSKGRSYPVDTRYAQPSGRPGQHRSGRTQTIVEDTGRAIFKALEQQAGDILVFLPGYREIRQVHQSLESRLPDHVHVHPLFGSLSQKDQDKAIRPSPGGHRKIVLSTSIAETSLTIQGISLVIDSGWMRVPIFSERTGMSRLETVPVSKAVADQRRGRAGRLGPGTCFRLWTEHEHQGLVAHGRPEILTTDLCDLALELAAWGVADPLQLSWIDPPPQTAFQKAIHMLKNLDALDSYGRITAHGKEMNGFGIHPRLAHMMIQGKRLGQGCLACRIAALLQEKDFINFPYDEYDADIHLRLQVLDGFIRHHKLGIPKNRVHLNVLKSVARTSHQFQSQLRATDEKTDLWQTGSLLALAFPDRICKRRDNTGTGYQMSSGSGAKLHPNDPLLKYDYLVAPTLGGAGREMQNRSATIFLAASYREHNLLQDFSGRLETLEKISWDNASQSVKARRESRLFDLTLKIDPIVDPCPDRVRSCLMDAIKLYGVNILHWPSQLNSLRARILFLAHSPQFDALPDVSDAGLTNHLERWLEPFLDGISCLKEIKPSLLTSAFLALLTWPQKQLIDTHAPTHLVVPSGSKLPLEYGEPCDDPTAPVLRVRLQEMFGLNQTPMIAKNNIPVMLHLLSPAGRPVQITQDLESFWKNTYPEVKKDMMGRYPKHYWPEDPLNSTATRRAKPRSRK
ncbi:MAG: ATP-dependent helicase HrpB [Desulfobacteraceae bacterium]|nr:MAG: ATP-dependent helicase HrpB [Desulfobacteraceae bacterium]